jgi:hypothetical protein
MQRFACTVGALVAASFLTAQTNRIVSPVALTNAHGTTFNSIPWGPFTSSENFVHTIYDDLMGTPRVLRAMAFRHFYSQNYVAKTYQVKVTLADAATTSSAISTTFASNFKTGGNSTVVFNGTLNWPAFPSVPRGPSPFAGVVAFTTNHVYTGVDPLLCEIFVMSSNPVTPTHFFERGPTSTHTGGVLGVGCNATGQTTPLNATGSVGLATATGIMTFTNTLASGPASAPAALFIGDTNSRLGGQIPLPVDLAIIGSPGCFVNINPLLSIGATTSASGGATSSITTPMTTANSGIRLRAQWAAVDGMQVRTSNGLDHGTTHNQGAATSGNSWGAARVYAVSFGTTPPPTGLSLGVQGLVTEWTY